MNSSWLYEQSSIWIVAALLMATLLGEGICCFAGRRGRPSSHEARRRTVGSVVGSLLRLLTLLVSFTFTLVIAVTVIGLYGGLANHRRLPRCIAATLLLSGTICVVLDRDKPHHGIMPVSQSPTFHLAGIMDRDPEASPK
jgi:uncharacterized membrane protein